MLFAVTYTGRGDSTEESEKRVLQLFANWKRPAGYEEKAHYGFSDGSGGLAMVEASTAAALYEGLSVWAPFFEFSAVPVVEISEGVSLLQRAYAWRDTVK